MTPIEIIPYNPNLKPFELQLRKTMTLPEILLWKELKGKKMFDYDFDRQRLILNYIVDFYCKKLKFAIEVDGDSHDAEDAMFYDSIRTEEMETFEIFVLRFTNEEVLKSMNNVLNTIEICIGEREETLGIKKDK